MQRKECKKPCPPDKLCNPYSGRCASAATIASYNKRNAAVPTSYTANAEAGGAPCKNPCPPDKLCNPASRRCVLKSGTIGQQLLGRRANTRANTRPKPLTLAEVKAQLGPKPSQSVRDPASIVRRPKPDYYASWTNQQWRDYENRDIDLFDRWFDPTKTNFEYWMGPKLVRVTYDLVTRLVPNPGDTVDTIMYEIDTEFSTKTVKEIEERAYLNRVTVVRPASWTPDVEALLATWDFDLGKSAFRSLKAAKKVPAHDIILLVRHQSGRLPVLGRTVEDMLYLGSKFTKKYEFGRYNMLYTWLH